MGTTATKDNPGHIIVVINPEVINTIETSSIDHTGRHIAGALSPTEFLNYLVKASLSET